MTKPQRSHNNSYSLVEYNKIYYNTNSWKTLQEESLWQENFDNLYFWNTLNKTHQGIFMWNRNNRLYTNNKKHVHKERKETTHVNVGERNIHHIYIYIYVYISKITTMYVNMVTRPVYKKKEVSIPPNKMKHISPLQKNVFLSLTCRILKKRNHKVSTISTPFCHDWQSVREARKLHPRDIKMIKDDQGGTKNP